ncbi:hypothetical protein Prudu_002493 [Prunus dulcis]|uniref:Uncharacterized protein n=1 Tax=Prunus dulcis TaxID=3755 RepID=A0A4Y1QQZ9_PRUDU|nr:hypothetical protein Prudu_002493 [Prunus dulcis]
MQKPREDVAFAHLLRLLGFFVFGFQQPQHRRLLARFATCNLQTWNFALLKNTRKVFSENHNVPMDTHKVFTALVQWGSCRSPSVIHNREVLVRALFVPRGTDIVEPVVASRMDANGQLYVQRVLDKKGLPIGQEYDRSMPLNSVQIDVPPEDRVTWFTTENVNSGYCEFIPDDGILKVCRVHGSKFEACTLMEVNNNTMVTLKLAIKMIFLLFYVKCSRAKQIGGVS